MQRELPVLTVQPRDVLGKKVKRLRRQGITPVHLYGPGTPSRALQAPSSTLRRLLQHVGSSRPLLLTIEGEEGQHLAFVREVQFHPLTTEVLHVDFYQVASTERVRVEVPLRTVGEAPVVRERGGSISLLLRTVEVEGLPLEVPQEVEVDLSALDSFDKVVRVADLPLPPGVRVRTDPEQAVVQVVPPEEEVRPAEEAPPAPPAPEEGEGPGE